MDVNFSPVDPAGLCADLAQTFRPIAEQQDLAFIVDMEPDLPQVVTDEHRVQQVLKNLLSNACKFTDQGSVTLSVGGAGPDRVYFRVEDTGIGISSDKLTLIFDAFQQADGTTSRRYGGTGLGLSISKEIARLLGGEIQVESEPGVGSKFTLVLPVSRGAEAPVRPEARMAALPSPAMDKHGDWSVLRGKRVLIVDDDVRNVYALTSALEDQGVIVLCAHDGRQGIEVLERSDHVDMVLMDVMMPEMDGYETTQAIRPRNVSPTCPLWR